MAMEAETSASDAPIAHFISILNQMLAELKEHRIHGDREQFRASIDPEARVTLPASFRLSFHLPPDGDWSEEDVLGCAHLVRAACTLSTLLQCPSEELKDLCWTVFRDSHTRWTEIQHHKTLLGRAHGKGAAGKSKPKAKNPIRERVRTAMREEKKKSTPLKVLLGNWAQSPPDKLSMTADDDGVYSFYLDGCEGAWSATHTTLEKVFSEARGG